MIRVVSVLVCNSIQDVLHSFSEADGYHLLWSNPQSSPPLWNKYSVLSRNTYVLYLVTVVYVRSLHNHVHYVMGFTFWPTPSTLCASHTYLLRIKAYIVVIALWMLFYWTINRKRMVDATCFASLGSDRYVCNTSWMLRPSNNARSHTLAEGDMF